MVWSPRDQIDLTSHHSTYAAMLLGAHAGVRILWVSELAPENQHWLVITAWMWKMPSSRRDHPRSSGAAAARK